MRNVAKKQKKSPFRAPPELVNACADIVVQKAKKEAAERAERKAVRATDEIAYSRLHDQRWNTVDRCSIAGVISHAAGTCEFDPIYALIQELPMRLRTIRAAMHSEEEYALSDQQLDMELYLVERRAEAALELYSRVGNAPSRSSAETQDIDAAAEE
jgi:hypothetical protein